MSIQTIDRTDDLRIEDVVNAVNQAGEATTAHVVGALFNGDHGSGDPEYKRTRDLLNDAADDGIIGKTRDGNANLYTQKTGLPEPDLGGDGATDTPDQVPEVTGDDLPSIEREHATGLDDLADEVPDDVEPDEDDDQGDDSPKGVAPTDSEIQSEFTVGDSVPDERVATCEEFVQAAAGDEQREHLSPPVPRQLHVDDPQMREFRIVKKNGRVKSPSSGLVVSEDAIADGLLPEDFDVNDPEESCIYARSPYCGSMRKLSVTEGANGIRLKFRSFNLPKTSPRTRSDEYLAFDDSEGRWTWQTVADDSELALDALARRARAGAAIPHKATLDEDGNLVDDGAPDEDEDDDSDGDN